MPTLKVVYKADTKEVQVLNDGVATPGGFVHVGNFDHPDATYPDSLVIYHGVRDILYTRSAANPANPAMFPDNITNMGDTAITNLATPLIKFYKNTPYLLGLVEHQDLSVEVIVTGGTPPFTYQWQKNYVDMVGQTSERLFIPDVFEGNAGVYTCDVTDDAAQTITSNEMEVDVGVNVQSTGLAATPNTLALSVATDAVNGKTSVITVVPAGAGMGTLSIKTAPLAGRATATLVGNVVTVKPVAAGGNTSVVITNGVYDISITISVAA